jgi:predicted acyl esterase
MVRRSVLKVLIAVAALLATALAGAEEVGPGYDIEMSHMIPMRDGVQLEAWIFHDAEHASQLILPLAASVPSSAGQ